MRKLNTAAFFIIAAGVLALVFTAVYFQFITYEEDGQIHGNWRASESTMFLGTARFISVLIGCVIAAGIILFLVSQDKLIRKQNIMEILFIALGAFTITGSLTMFFPCTEMLVMSDRPMRCYWTMKDMLGVAGAISITGVLMLIFNKSREFIKGLNCAVIILCGLYILIPVKMTGFCFSAMPCVENYRPFTMMMGFLMLGLSVINAFLLYKGANRNLNYMELTNL